MTENSVRGATRSRGGATDTTMLIWKVIAASPGITRAQIWEQVEHSIPEGYAIRLYMRNGAPWITDPSLIQVDRARRFVLTDVLKKMRREPASLSWEGEGIHRRYTVARDLDYHGNPDAIDETGTKAAEHMAVADALRIVEKMLGRANMERKHGPLVCLGMKEYQAVTLLAKTLRASSSA